jgi:hypothetical protein
MACVARLSDRERRARSRLHRLERPADVLRLERRRREAEGGHGSERREARDVALRLAQRLHDELRDVLWQELNRLLQLLNLVRNDLEELLQLLNLLRQVLQLLRHRRLRRRERWSDRSESGRSQRAVGAVAPRIRLRDSCHVTSLLH